MCGTSYDNAMAEVIGLFKTRQSFEERDPGEVLTMWSTTLDWDMSWYNEQRLLEPIGYIPPVEFEQVYYRNEATPVTVAGVN